MNYTYAHPRPAVTTDAVIFRMVEEDTLEILLIQRDHDPFAGCWALPGGFVEMDETLEKCVAREIEEETGLTGLKFYPLEAFSEPLRDPRDRVISFAFWAFCYDTTNLKAGSDAREVAWKDLNQLPDLAFDHNVIIKKALKKALEVMAE